MREERIDGGKIPPSTAQRHDRYNRPLVVYDRGGRRRLIDKHPSYPSLTALMYSRKEGARDVIPRGACEGRVGVM